MLARLQSSTVGGELSGVMLRIQGSGEEEPTSSDFQLLPSLLILFWQAVSILQFPLAAQPAFP